MAFTPNWFPIFGSCLRGFGFYLKAMEEWLVEMGDVSQKVAYLTVESILGNVSPML